VGEGEVIREQISADPLSWTPEYRAGVIDLLGVLAYGELSACQRMAADAALAGGRGW